MSSTFLTNRPTAPAGFLNVSENLPGRYNLGRSNYIGANIRLLPLLRREFGSSDEIVLAILSVFLIGFLSELVHAVLLRRRAARGVSAAGMRAASLVDEVVHIRHVFSLCWGRRPPRGPHDRDRIRLATSLMVISIALLLFMAEVASVLLTQPAERASRAHEFNLRAVQPVGTSRGMSLFIRRTTGDANCVSPIVIRPKQVRTYLLQACFTYDNVKELASDGDFSTEIVMMSWYHIGGSNHYIKYGPGSFNLSIRASVLLNLDDAPARRLLFQNLDDDNMSYAKYLHDRAMHSAIEWSCKKYKEGPSCEQLAQDLNTTYEGPTPLEDIRLWQGRTKMEGINVTGHQTTYAIRLQNPNGAINQGISALVPSAAVLEVKGKGDYINVKNDEKEDGIAGLIVEQGRVAGVMLFGLVVVGLFIVLMMIRWWLKPASLADFAIDNMPNGDRYLFHEELGTGDIRPGDSFDLQLARIQNAYHGDSYDDRKG